MINWGILGTSFISEQMALAISESSDGHLYAIGSRSQAGARKFADKYPADVIYDNFQSLIEDPKVDVVYIALPNHLHKLWMLRCFEHGKPVLCEKPLVLTEGDAKEVIEAAKKTGLFCMEALMYRCHPVSKKLSSILESGILGDIQTYQAYYAAKIDELANPEGGGAINNLGCYPLSLVLFLAQAIPSNLIATGKKHPTYNKNDSLASAMLTFEDNSIATITTSDALDFHWSFKVFGTKGRLEMVTNPWLPLPGEQIIHLYPNEQETPEVIRLETPLSVYTYQINTVNDALSSVPDSAFEGVTLLESLSVTRVLESWRNQVA